MFPHSFAVPTLSKWCAATFHSFQYIILRSTGMFEGVHHRRSNVKPYPTCLQFPDLFKSRTAVLVRITFTSGSSKLTRYRGNDWPTALALAPESIECRSSRPCRPSSLVKPCIRFEGCDYLNHWSSSFHAIQIQVSVKKLSYGSLPADLFESPEGYPTDCSFIAIYMLKTSLINLF